MRENAAAMPMVRAKMGSPTLWGGLRVRFWDRWGWGWGWRLEVRGLGCAKVEVYKVYVLVGGKGNR